MAEGWSSTLDSLFSIRRPSRLNRLAVALRRSEFVLESHVRRDQRKRRRGRLAALRRLVELGLTVALVAGPIALVVLWLAFQHKPGWYRPAVLDDAGVQRAQRDAVSMADRVSDRMAEGKPFDVVLVDRSVNEWLAALPHAWPDARDALPPELTQPVVRFIGQPHGGGSSGAPDRLAVPPGEIIVGAHFARGGWRAIASGRFSLRVSADGTMIEIGWNGAYGGSLRLPEWLVEKLLGEQPVHRWITGINGKAGAKSGTTDRSGIGGRAAWRSSSAAKLLKGFEIDNRFVWFNGERPFRIDSIEIDEGELHLRIEPR